MLFFYKNLGVSLGIGILGSLDGILTPKQYLNIIS
jgi:hypothetical protein